MHWIQMIAAIIISVVLSTMIAAYLLRRVADRIFQHLDEAYSVIERLVERFNP